MLDPEKGVCTLFFSFCSLEIPIETHTTFFCYRAMPIASINYSVKPFVDLFNTWHGQLMVKVSIVISSDKKMLKEGEPVPEIFTDPAFGQSSHWELNMSQLSSRLVLRSPVQSGFLFKFGKTGTGTGLPRLRDYEKPD
jgi:hypothetical protein